MRTGTAVLRQQEEELRQAERQRQLARREAKRKEAELQSIVDFKKHKASHKVRAASMRAVGRLSADGGRGWKLLGSRKRVCRRSGPHSGFWCFLHQTKIAVVSIPDMQVRELSRDCHWDDVGGYGRIKTQVHFYLGDDERVYRQGRTKIYRAELIKRDWPSEIKAVADNIDKIYT